VSGSLWAAEVWPVMADRRMDRFYKLSALAGWSRAAAIGSVQAAIIGRIQALRSGLLQGIRLDDATGLPEFNFYIQPPAATVDLLVKGAPYPVGAFARAGAPELESALPKDEAGNLRYPQTVVRI
jgi:hypothetical protein